MSAWKEKIKSVLSNYGYRISRNDQVVFFEALLSLYLQKSADFFYIQIGANDGISFDPLYPLLSRHSDKVRGIAVEPMKDAFDQLCINLQKYHNIEKINFAIHNTEKEMELHKVDPKKLKTSAIWSKGIASFNAEHHKLSGVQKDSMIIEKVNCISYKELLERHKVTNIDLLQIDTEGYDAEILLNIDFNVNKPAIIHFEHGLQRGIMKRDLLLKVADVLNKNGYQVVLEANDATAYDLRSYLSLS